MVRLDLPSLSPDDRTALQTLVGLLDAANLRHNLTAPAAKDVLWKRHVEDGLMAVPVFRGGIAPGKKCLLDIGSGAGFPGLPLAQMLPDWRVTSLEATGKKAEFQAEAAAGMGLVNFQVVHDRAETLGHSEFHREQYDVVTARAVAALPALLEMGSILFGTVFAFLILV